VAASELSPKKIISHRFEPGPRVVRVPGSDPGGGLAGAGESHRRSHRLCFLRLAPLRIGGHSPHPEDDQVNKTTMICWKTMDAEITGIDFSQSAQEIGDVCYALLGFRNVNLN
jgi:hypothetical protein